MAQSNDRHLSTAQYAQAQANLLFNGNLESGKPINFYYDDFGSDTGTAGADIHAPEAWEILNSVESREGYERGLFSIAVNQFDAKEALKTAENIIKPRRREKTASRDAEFSYHRALGEIAAQLSEKGDAQAALHIADDLEKEGGNVSPLEAEFIRSNIARRAAEQKRYEEALHIVHAMPDSYGSPDASTQAERQGQRSPLHPSGVSRCCAPLARTTALRSLVAPSSR